MILCSAKTSCAVMLLQLSWEGGVADVEDVGVAEEGEDVACSIIIQSVNLTTLLFPFSQYIHARFHNNYYKNTNTGNKSNNWGEPHINHTYEPVLTYVCSDTSSKYSSRTHTGARKLILR